MTGFLQVPRFRSLALATVAAVALAPGAFAEDSAAQRPSRIEGDAFSAPAAKSAGDTPAETAPPTVPWLVDEVARLRAALEAVSDVAARGGSAEACAEVARRAIEGEGKGW